MTTTGPAPAQVATLPNPPAITVEAEEFAPQGKSVWDWRVVKNGQGNYMVDIIGFNHVSGERLLSAPAESKDVAARARVLVPESGTYRMWSRFEQPSETENRFRVEVRQNGQALGSAVMGERKALKYFFGGATPVAQADPSWGSEGLVEQSFDVAGLQKGEAEIILTALDQSTLPAPRANRNVDFLFLTQDLQDSWRAKPSSNKLYPILDAALAAIPTRYYLRLSSPGAQTVRVRYLLNRLPWYLEGGNVLLKANKPSPWLPLTFQDVCHFTTLQLIGAKGKGLNLRVELASSADGKNTLRAIDWNDSQSNEFLVSLPPYPGKYAGEKIETVEEQYHAVAAYLKAHPSSVARAPIVPLNRGSYLPVWQNGRVGDAAADVYFGIGMRAFVGLLRPDAAIVKPALEIARRRFIAEGLTPQASIALGEFRFAPTPQNIEKVRSAATAAGIMPLLQNFDYGDEIAFSTWLAPLSSEELATRFAAWQQKHKGKIEFPTPDSSAQASQSNPRLYVDSMRFYEVAAIDFVASQAKAIPLALGSRVLYGANVAAHPFYYPEIAKYVKWFRPTQSGDYAANYGRHSEYFWQVGLPGPLIDGYVAEHFRAGMKENPHALLQQYTMPHAPGTTDKDFRRAAFTHLAHGARGLDYFGIGLNHSFTENYIDFRAKERYAAIRDVNRAMATVEDILPQSQVAPSRIALILSDSTEHWDFAPIARDKAGFSVFGENYKQTRLAFHQERVGIYYALVHASRAPDLLIEEDVQRGDLSNYDVAYWVGDCAEGSTLAALQKWVASGGHLVATAGALRYDQYQNPTPDSLKLLGLASAKLDARQWFFRPQIELPRMEPIDAIESPGGAMPVLALKDDVAAAPGARVRAAFAGGKPAVIENLMGKGTSTFIAALPGVAYLWGAYQNAGGKNFVPSRGPSSHLDLSGFDAAARNWIVAPALKVLPPVDAPGAKIDARLLLSPVGYAIPLANYQADVSKPITLVIRVPGVKSISSAVAGKLKFTREKNGVLKVKYSPGAGDILRLDR